MYTIWKEKFTLSNVHSYDRFKVNIDGRCNEKKFEAVNVAIYAKDVKIVKRDAGECHNTSCAQNAH